MSETATDKLDPAATDETSSEARNGAAKRRDPNEAAAVVGLGASAGGITPLQQFFADMDPKSGLAFVVVMHLSPEYESQLANVIQQKTAMPVMQVNRPVRVQPNHVYVIPPNHQLTFEDSTLHLLPPQQPLGRRVTIDLFFRTLAQAYGQRAVCVIMSGTDSDGVIGLKHIRAQGGLTIVQDPNEAEHDSMPMTAISTGMVDWVLPVEKMAPRLLEFVRNENRMKLPPEIPDAEESDAKVEDAPGGETVSDETREVEDELAIGEVLADLRAHTGHDFSHYKRATVLRRIARRLQVNSLETIPQYLEFIRTHPIETRDLLQDLLIGVTHFFRDREAFAALEAHIPQLFTDKNEDDEVRAWVAGCATGEEAYSIAMLLCEHAERLDNPPRIQVFATDVDEHSIADARIGLYPSMIEADVSPERLREFFVRDHGRYRVRKEIREKVLFASHNVLKDAPFSRCDLISCRNLLIYLTSKAQEQAFDIFHFSLRSGGLLFIGGSENHSHSQSLFSSVDAKHRLFVRRSTPRPIWRVPLLPPGGPVRTARPPGRRARPLPALTQSGAGKASGDGLEANRGGHARREMLFGELHLRLLEQYGPPSVVVNQSHEIVHLSESAGRYLHFVAGEPTANIIQAVNPALQIELRTALFRAEQTKEAVKTTPQVMEVGSSSETVTLDVRPMRASDQAQGFFLVLFEKQSEPAASVAPVPQVAMTREADNEIQLLKEQLSGTVEQYEAANEELKASNEELQATNEELRSTAEELETSKEELQSVNEELSTVNHELKNSIEDLSHANADLNNLMASSDIGTIFLDRQLRIHRFTPSAQKIFNLIPSDMGRPIADITSKLNYEGFIDDAETVLRDLVTIEHELRLGENTWYLARMAPYRTSEDHIAGVVATFVDITRRKTAEEKVRAGAVRYRTLFDLVPVAVYATDAKGVIEDYNQRAVELWGRAPREGEEFCGSFKILRPDGTLMPHEECPMARVLRDEKLEPADLEITVEQEDGRRKNVIVSPSVLRNERGEITGAINCLYDITERKQSEEALRASEARFRSMFEQANVGIVQMDSTGRFLSVNPGFCSITGYSGDELRKMRVSDFIESADWKKEKELLRQLAADEIGEYTMEKRYHRKDGVEIWVTKTATLVRGESGEALYTLGIVQPITERKQAQEQLRLSEERYRLLVDGASDYAIFMVNPSNEIVYWSAGAERVFGWSAEEAIGKSGELVFTPEDRAKEQEEKEIAIALRDGTASDRRWHIRKDGTRIWVDGVMHRLDDAETGALRGFAKVARDRTEQRRAEEELQRAHEELEKRVLERTAELRARNRQLRQEMDRRQRLEQEILHVSEQERARISEDLHDSLCQELTATAFLLKSRGKAIALQNKAAADSLAEAAETVNANAGLARDLARGMHPLELGSAGLPSALRELCSRTSETINCRCDVPRSMRLDESLSVNLYRIAQEAVTNSVRHARASEIVISLERTNGEIVLTVSDNGAGKGRRGRGLGTKIMKYRANTVGGTLDIESTRGRGTTVTCRVPLKS